MPGFINVVQQAWVEEISGTPLFRVVQKLWRVKENIIEWRKSHPTLSTKLQDARTLLETIQKHMIEEPNNISVQGQELLARYNLDSLDRAEESMYK